MNEYDDIINLPHYVSKKHPHMDGMSRAAQFAPFAALTGLDDAIDDAGQQAEDRMRKSEENEPYED